VEAYRAAPWADFAVAVAGSGAALAGLLFVALSINLERILTGQRLTARAGYTLVLVAVPVAIALVLLVPGQSPTALGAELLVIGVVTGVSLAALHRPSRRSPKQPLVWWFVTEGIPAAVLSLSSIIGGAGVLTGSIGGLYWLPAGVIAAFVGALVNAWVLLVEILR
jgi:modulator of FtsH protease